MPTASRTLTVRTARPRYALRRVLSIGATAVVCLGLTACTAGPSPAPSASSRAGAPTPSPTSPGGTLDATRLKVACDHLVPAAAIQSSYSGMTAVEKPRAPRDTDAAVIAAYGGTICAWKSSTGQTMTLAVGHFAEASLTALKNSLVTSSNPVPTYQGEGYFRVDGATGTAEAFSDPYWVVGISKAFTEPGGAEPLVDAAIATLAARG